MGLAGFGSCTERMKGFVGLALSADSDVDICAGHGDVGMPEEIFDDVDVHAVFVEMCRAGMAEGVGCESSADGFVAFGDS